MSVIRVAKRDRFTAIDRRTIRDDSLSFRARGVLVWLLDKPENWSARADAIASQGKEGRAAVLTALRELVDAGYLVRRKWQDDESGQWHHESVVHERPMSGSSDEATSRLPDVGYPAPGNRPLEEEPEKEELQEPPNPPQSGGLREAGTNPRAQGSNPRGPREMTAQEQRDADLATQRAAAEMTYAKNAARAAAIDADPGIPPPTDLLNRLRGRVTDGALPDLQSEADGGDARVPDPGAEGTEDGRAVSA